MKRTELRLELLKLTYAHGLASAPAEAVARAKVLEAFVSEPDPSENFKPGATPVEVKKGKKSGTADILS